MVAQTGRLAGYRQALTDHGMCFDERLQCDVLNNGPALRAVEALFDTEQPDGFFCFNDARALCIRDGCTTWTGRGTRYLSDWRGQSSRICRDT